MKWRGLLAGLLLAGALLPAGAYPAAEAQVDVDLELLLAVDISGSIDEEEAALQRKGYIAAIRSGAVLSAIRSGRLRRIALAYAEWAGEGFQQMVVDWRIVKDEVSAQAFAKALAAAPVGVGPYTSISGAIEFAVPLFAANRFRGARRVVDISGDGPNNSGGPVTPARDRAVRAGVTINGLPIMNNRPSRFGFMPMPDLDLYYRECVIGGPGAFIIVAKTFRDFARAIRRKMVLEIAGRRPEDGKKARFVPAAAPRRGLRPAPACDVGERRLRQRLRDLY